MLLPADPRLTDGVVALRRPAVRDLPGIEVMRGDPDVRRWALGGVPNGTAAGTLARFEEGWEKGVAGILAITLATMNEYLGHAGVFLDLRRHGIGELGYILCGGGRGRGLATRSCRLIARWAFDELEIERLEARTHPENAASHRVLERLSFTREGLERSARRLPFASDRIDCLCWSLLPGELL